MKSLITLLGPKYFIGRHNQMISVGDIIHHADVSHSVSWRVMDIKVDQVIIESCSWGSNSGAFLMTDKNKIYK